MANGPLTDNDLNEINESLKALDEADALIDQSTRAGIDVIVQKDESREARTRLMKIKQTFFPGR